MLVKNRPYVANDSNPMTVSCVPKNPPRSFRWANNHLKYGSASANRLPSISESNPYDVISTSMVFDGRSPGFDFVHHLSCSAINNKYE